jgi:hypothetical protein
METLRGRTITDLNLVPRFIGIKEGSELLLLSCAPWRNEATGDVVGDFLKGNCGWIYSPALRDGNQTYIMGGSFANGHPVADKIEDGIGYLTLDHIKQLLLQSPDQHLSK